MIKEVHLNFYLKILALHVLRDNLHVAVHFVVNFFVIKLISIMGIETKTSRLLLLVLFIITLLLALLTLALSLTVGSLRASR